MTNEEISTFNTNDFYEGVSIIEKYWNQNYGTFDIEGKDNDGYKPSQFFQISYCPMCGRKLGDD